MSAKLVVSRSPLAQFTDDTTFLLRYPHGCLEQTTSTAFPLLYYTDLAAGMEYLLEQEEHQQLMLHCNAHNEVKRVYWYINDKFLRATAANEKVFFEPQRDGRYKISCTDDQGRNTDSYITVRIL